MKQKAKTWQAMSRFTRLKEALTYCRTHCIDLSQFNRPEDIVGECCTCGKVKSWIRMDCGHFIGRGLGGGSGVYFDSRNVHLQCKQCNMSKQNSPEYEQYMLNKYDAGVINELKMFHRLGKKYKSGELASLELYYQRMYKSLCKGI